MTEAATPTAWDALATGSRAVALEVLVHGPLARSELAARLLLSPGSLTRLAGPLVEQGILYEVDRPHHTPSGRPGRGLQVVPDLHHFVGVQLTQTAAENFGKIPMLAAFARSRRTPPPRAPGRCCLGQR